ncbi:type I inositol polyphosphate 5-phosphatase 2 isoform X1 [Typha latifolia]|uniref:type I inositol polyphosphate 5-phosphatase 2 isoform X1 n=2 Tax=Typha latifolia TaxID=4733 RepID=UPI003C2C359D
MRTRKGKQSESFWPYIMMRKWLNIKPKVDEFSEDEVETESEDDDSRNTKEDCFFENLERNSACPAELIGRRKQAPSRIRRRKSETFRVNYISKKDVRVMIGTWNVAGRIPFEEIELDDWLCAKQSADIYILGFQEVVPLNAGNVLGTEDSRPISKWEAIIRRTLNKSPQPKTSYKSYSAPSSPILIRPSNPTMEDKIDAAGHSEDGYSRGKELDWNIDWPEYSLDSPPQALKSRMNKLRRVMSSLEAPNCDHDPQDVALKAGLRRVPHSSGNLGMLWSEQQDTFDVLESLDVTSDRISEEEYETEMIKECPKPRPRYVRVVSKQMVGIYISVWVCRRLRSHVNNLKVSPVGVGLMGYMGNKGSVSVSMSVFQTRLCFVCSHLSSGHKAGDQQRRNSDVCEILQRTRFSSFHDADQPQTIPSHDRIFWFGDLNYRLNMLDGEIRALVAMKRWDELMNFDQLSKELTRGHIFYGWKEGLINFAPTYKYEINSNMYAGENAKEGEKRRSPAWCDRILWLGEGIRQLSYWMSELSLSDHRPVSSIFSVQVEVFDQRKLERILNFTNAGFSSEKYSH